MDTFLVVAVPVVVVVLALRHAWPLFSTKPFSLATTMVVGVGIGAACGESVAYGGDMALVTNLEVMAVLSLIAGVFAFVFYGRGETQARRGSMYMLFIGLLWLAFWGVLWRASVRGALG